MTACEEKPKETLTTVLDETLKKKALELGRACFMFTSVLMRPTGVQYHIDLAQNILTTAMSSDLLKNELYANLIKLTSGSMSYGIQVFISFSFYLFYFHSELRDHSFFLIIELD